MKNYAAIILALTAYDLTGQTVGIPRFLFEPVIRPYDWRPPTDYNASRGVGGRMDTENNASDRRFDNRVTPNVHGNPSAYGLNPTDFNGTFDRNALTYNMPNGMIYNGPHTPIERMAIGNPLNNWNERWHTAFDPDIVRQNPGHFNPPDNRYNPNLTLHGNIADSPWEFFASPQMNMADPLNGLRHPALATNLNYLTTQKSDGSFFVNDHRLTTLNWDTMAHEENWAANQHALFPPGAMLGPQYNTQMQRIDNMEMGGYYQDGEAVGGSGDGWFSCAGLTADHLPNTPAWHHHTWEKRHFSSLTRAGLGAKRSIPMDGVYAFIATGGPGSVHWFDRGGGELRESWHWGWAEGIGTDKPIFNVGYAWVGGGPGGDPFITGNILGGGFGGPGSGMPVEDIANCGHYNGAVGAAYVPGDPTFDGGFGVNERYGPGAIYSTITGNGNQTVVPNAPAASNLAIPFTVTGTTSTNSLGFFIDVNGVQQPVTYVRENPQGPNQQLAGHPAELSGSGLSPWDQHFGYDLSRFFGDFYIRPSVHTVNMNDSGDPNVNTGLAVDRRASRVSGFMDPIDPENQVSTRSLDNILLMGDLRTKIRHINRFPQSGLDYLFQVPYQVDGTDTDHAGNPLINSPTLPGPNANRLPVYVQ